MNQTPSQITSSLLGVRAQRFLRIALALHTLAFACLIVRSGSNTGNFLFLTIDMDEAIVLRMEQTLASALILGGLLLLGRWSTLVLCLVGGVGLLEGLFETFFSGHFCREWTLAAHAIRYLTPLTMAYVLMRSYRVRLESLVIFKLATAMTFFAHGVEALSLHPLFTDYLITASAKLLWFTFSQAEAEAVLLGIGAIDIASAVLLLLTGQRWISVYMLFWAVITVGARLVYTPNLQGLLEAAVRSTHIALPFVLLVGHQACQTTTAALIDSVKQTFILKFQFLLAKYARR